MEVKLFMERFQVILALDQATTTGYAITDRDGTILDSGVWHLADPKRSGESRGMRYIRFEKELQRIIKAWDVGLIIHEQTLLRGGAATEIANGLKALILKTAVECNIEVSCVHTTELKKWATGNGSADKALMIQTATRYMTDQNQRYAVCKPSPIDDNEADAVLIGLWASSQYGAFPAPVFEKQKKTPKKRSPGSKKKQKQSDSMATDLFSFGGL
jgi:Holliday junction resolvasome RuvABC endonuclease subunit